eukprot:c20236_g1_i1.p1 GENE.c20236_g1_i1~~c20236_g1_i1.p1  ORF type:complete len:2031 (+),score=311.09 c20236_g1_i1:438-6095(+)
MFYADPTITSVFPTSVAVGKVVTLNLTTELLSTSLSGSGSYSISCLFFKFEDPTVRLGTSIASLVEDQFLVQCDTIPTIQHGKTLLQIVISSNSREYGSNTQDFYYFGPEINAITPPLGKIEGGTHILVSGVHFNFAFGYTCHFVSDILDLKLEGSLSLSTYPPSIACVTPPSHAGFVNVSVSLNGQDFSDPFGFLYYEPANITDFFPTSCSADGGCRVLVTGQGFLDSPLANYTCQLGASVDPATYLGESSLVCVAPKFDDAVKQPMVQVDIAGSASVATQATMVRDFEFLSPTSFRNGIVEVIESGKRARVGAASGFESVFAGPALDYANHVEIDLLVLHSDSLFIGVATRDVNVAKSLEQKGLYGYFNAPNGSGIFSTEGDQRLYGPGFQKGNVVTLIFNFGRLAFHVNGEDQGLAVAGLNVRPYYVIVGDATDTDLSEGGFDVRIIEVRQLANYSAILLTQDKNSQTGGLAFPEMGHSPLRGAAVSGDIWTGPDVDRFLDPGGSQEGGDGVTILYGDISNLVEFQLKRYAAVKLSTHPNDSELIFLRQGATDPTAVTQCRETLYPSVRESGWRTFRASISKSGIFCAQFGVGRSVCCDFGSDFEEFAQVPGFAMAIVAQTGDLTDLHAVRNLKATYTPTNETADVHLSISPNLVEYVFADSTFRISGRNGAAITFVEPQSGELGDTIRLWGRNLAGGTGYACRFETATQNITTDALFEEPDKGPTATDPRTLDIELGPIKCNIPTVSSWNVPPPVGTIISLSVSLNRQQFITNPQITFTVLQDFSIVAMSPHSGPVSGNTQLVIAISDSNLLQFATIIRCRFSSNTRSELVDGFATLNKILCSSPEVKSPAETVVFVTLNGLKFVTALALPSEANYAFYGEPVITSITPLQGYTIGGEIVTVSGKNLLQGRPDEYICRFVGSAHQQDAAVQVSDNVTCITPEWPVAEVVLISISPNSQQFDSSAGVANRFRFYIQPTNISGPDPLYGPTTGDTTVVFFSRDFVAGDQPQCRFSLRGTSITVDAILNSEKNTLTCRTPQFTSAGPATVELSLFTPEFVQVNNTFAFLDEPRLTSLEYASGFLEGGIDVVAFVNMTFFRVENPKCVFSDGHRSLQVVPKLGPTRISCVAPHAGAFKLNPFSSVGCFFSSDDLCSDKNLQHSLSGDAQYLSNASVVRLTQARPRSFGAFTLEQLPGNPCSIQFNFGTDIFPGSSTGADGVLMSIGVAAPSSLDMALNVTNTLVAFISFYQQQVTIVLSGVEITTKSFLTPQRIGVWHHLEMTVEDGILSLFDSTDRLIDPIALSSRQLSTIGQSSSCKYTVGALSYDDMDEYLVSAVTLVSEVVKPVQNVSLTLTFDQNFVSNPLQFTYTPHLIVRGISPESGPDSGGTIVTLNCDHVSDEWTSVICFFGNISVPAQVFSSNQTLVCISPRQPTIPSKPLTIPLTVLINEKFRVPVPTETVEFLYYSEPRVLDYFPHSGPVTGGSLVSLNVTNIDPAIFPDHHQGNKLELACMFGDIAVPAHILDVHSSSVNLTCISPKVDDLAVLPTTLSLVLNRNPDQRNQRIANLRFTFFDPPHGTSLTRTSSTSIRISPVLFDQGTQVLCWIGILITPATRVDSSTISCSFQNAFEIGAANVLSFSSSLPDTLTSSAIQFVGDAIGGANGLRLTPPHPNTQGTVVVTLPFTGTAFRSFHVEFDAQVVSGQSQDLVGGDGFSFSFGELDIKELGESGYGLGIRVMFRTFVTKAVEVVVGGTITESTYVGETCTVIFAPQRALGKPTIIDCTPFDQIRNGTNHVLIEWVDDHLLVQFAGRTIVSQSTSGLVKPSPDWVFAFGARTGSSGDSHQIDNLSISTGSVLRAQPVPVFVSLNGQQFIPVAHGELIAP